MKIFSLKVAVFSGMLSDDLHVCHKCFLVMQVVRMLASTSLHPIKLRGVCLL